MKKYEILAPVGSRESFFAAISAGADAIYMGGKLFNARHYASNFEIDEIRELVKYAHLRCVKIYITMNTLLKDEELKETLEYIKDLYEAGVDALIIQDLGLYYILSKYCPEFEIHASTQMSVHNASGVAVCEKMGFSRVVLAREVKISEILKASKVGPELEVFVHGALCQSYSGQCLMSSMLGGRSGNRGRCAQPCRLPYEIVNVDSENTIGKTKYYLSPKDLCTIDRVSELLEAGVHSLKIEGRMKRPEYVATVVNHYKTKLEETERDSSDKMIEELMQIFNRGFTEGLAFNDRGADYFSEDKPNNRGIELGSVRASKNKNNWIIESSRGLESGDGIEFRFESKSYGMIIDEIKEIKSNCYELYFKENLAGFTAYRTSQKKLIDKAQMWSKEKRIPHKVRLWIELKEGDTLKLRAFEEENEIWVSAEGDVPSQKAQKIGLSEEKIMQSLSKLKDTYFEFDEVNADIQEGLFLQVKEINSCRRKLVEKLEEIYHKRPELDSNREIVSDELFSKSKNSLRNKELYLSANYRDLSKFSKDHLQHLNRVYLPISELDENFAKSINRGTTEIFATIDRILSEDELVKIDAKLDSISKYLDGVEVSNIAHLEIAKKYNLKIHAGAGFNIMNHLAVRQNKGFKITSMTLSPELNLKELKNLSEYESGEYSYVVYGRLPLMIMRNCPFSVITKCKNDCKNCKYKTGHGLKDRKEKIFPILKDAENNSVLYNSQKILLTDHLNLIKNCGLSEIRLEFVDESVMEIEETINYYIDYLEKGKKAKRPKYIDELVKQQKHTKGHMQRGVE